MNSPSSPDARDNQPDFEPSPETALDVLQDVQQQQTELKVEVERMHQEVERFRNFFQTLIGGLVLAIAVAFGIAIWYAYRSFSEQQIARQAVEDITDVQDSIAADVDRLEDRVQQLEQDLPERAGELDEVVQSNQADLRQLRDRLDRLEAQLETLDESEGEENAEEPAIGADADRP